MTPADYWALFSVKPLSTHTHTLRAVGRSQSVFVSVQLETGALGRSGVWTGKCLDSGLSVFEDDCVTAELGSRSSSWWRRWCRLS